MMFIPFISDLAAGFLKRRAEISAEKYRKRISEKCEAEENRQKETSLSGKRHAGRMGREEKSFVICGFAYRYKMRCLLILTGTAAFFCLPVFALTGARSLFIKSGILFGILMLAETSLMILSGKKCGIVEYSAAEICIFGFSENRWRRYTTAQIREVRKKAGVLILKIGSRPENIILTAESVGWEKFCRFLSERCLL